MTVEELIKKYEKVVRDYVGITSYKEFLDDLKQIEIIEHNQKMIKAKLPQNIADYLEVSKGWDDDYQAYQEDNAISLQDAMDYDSYGMDDPIMDWFDVRGNDELFARAWLYGYEAEEELRYWAVKTVSDYLRAGKNILAISGKSSAQETADLIGCDAVIEPVKTNLKGVLYVTKDLHVEKEVSE